ncbi:MAG: RIP metalloprotease RseP [Verrucomicrobia bacterium]|nr:MAG: RIP metalloprotease RseP [Verrucomicrobiota bacterium]
MFFGILKVIGILLEVVLLFNLLIVVHELGHFVAARWCGLKVEKFAIWFGKPLWSKTVGGVEYRLGSIPAGGFVAIPQLGPMEALEGETNEKGADLPPARPIDKIIVALAGPVASLGLAFLFACVVWCVGRPVSQAETTNMIGYVLEGGPAAKAGMLPGDRILAVNGQPVKRINGMGRMGDSVAWNVAVSSSPVIPIRFERDGVEKIVEVEPLVQPKKGWGRKNLRQIQIMPAMTPMVAKVAANSPAAEAGLRGGDLVVAANGQKLLSQPALAEILNATKGSPVTLTIRRGSSSGVGGSDLTVTVTPRIPDGQKQARIGIFWDERGIVTLTHPNPITQIRSSILTMWETISAVTAPHSEISVQQLSGPVGIMRIYYLLFESPMGWQLALWFSVVLNVNLAVMNLLPLPVLDGGHILLALIEWACGHPIHQKTLEVVQTAFAMLLIGTMLYISFFDVSDLVTGHKSSTIMEKSTETMTFSPTTSPAATAPAKP